MKYKCEGPCYDNIKTGEKLSESFRLILTALSGSNSCHPLPVASKTTATNKGEYKIILVLYVPV